MLSDLCNPGLCKVTPPTAIPLSNLATLPAASQPAPEPVASEQNLATQMQLQQKTQEVNGKTVHTCQLQVMLQRQGLACIY